VRISGHEMLAFALGGEDGPGYPADVSAIHVNADGYAVIVGVADTVYVAGGGRDGFDLAWLEPDLGAVGNGPATAVQGERLTVFGPTQHADQAPYGVVMDGGVLAGSPDKAHDRKELVRIHIKDELLVMA